MIPVRESDIKDVKKIAEIYNKAHRKNIQSEMITFYKDVIKINIILEKDTSISQFKVILNNLNQKCSTRILNIIKLFYPSDLNITFDYKDFLETVKVMKNIKWSDFNKEIINEDHEKLKELEKFIKPGAWFTYKLLKIRKSYSVPYTLNGRLTTINYANEITNNNHVLLYLKSFDDSLNEVITKCKLRAISEM